MIEEKTIYVTRGKTFSSHEAAISHREDLIGAFFDSLPFTLHPRERIKLANFVIENRKELTDLLDY